MPDNPFDKGSRYAAKSDSECCLGWLLPGVLDQFAFDGWLDTRTIPFPGDPDRTSDTVACLVDRQFPEQRWALPIEFQGTPDPEMFGRLLEYLGRFWREQRPPGVPQSRYNVAAVVVNLTGVGSTSREMVLGQLPVKLTLQVAERNLSQQSAAETLSRIQAGELGRGVLPWIPLMQGGADAGIISLWKALAEQEPDPRRRADYGGLALVFSELARCYDTWKQALEGWNMEQSVQVLQWQAEGEKRGKIEGKIELLMRLLQRLFPGDLPADLVQRISECRDATLLDRWFDDALVAASLDDFLHQIGQ